MSHYPKRKRPEVSYRAVPISDSELGEDSSDDLNDDEVEDDSYGTKKTKKQKKSQARRPRNSRILRKPTVFRFMDLPPELRIMIFELVVTNYDNTVYMSLSRFKPGIKLRRRLAESRMLPRYRNLRLLRANKRIYHEATAVFYQQVFSFNTATSLHTFLALQRPQTIPLLRHIALRVEAQEWPLMLGISVQMCQLVSLSTLSLSEVTCSHGREFEGYLRHTNRPPTEEYWGEQSIVMWDKLTGIKLAKDLYAPMFPLFRKVISERGVDGLARMIECKANYRCHGHFWPTDPIFKTFEAFKNFWRAPDTKERQILRATSMAQEFVRLIGLDPS